ncbi:hypothetical protein L6452_15545 [Arctium lappa]|uniref:Uncharacterized protein n=1 Tax=Arctium lappa TaxID=4217 RepID=A0ACB9CNZ7_ARCLA|nr:hypothetical protein L6452_15545 [Arctium lappa]
MPAEKDIKVHEIINRSSLSRLVAVLQQRSRNSGTDNFEDERNNCGCAIVPAIVQQQKSSVQSINTSTSRVQSSIIHIISS